MSISRTKACVSFKNNAFLFYWYNKQRFFVKNSFWFFMTVIIQFKWEAESNIIKKWLWLEVKENKLPQDNKGNTIVRVVRVAITPWLLGLAWKCKELKGKRLLQNVHNDIWQLCNERQNSILIIVHYLFLITSISYQKTQKKQIS